VGRRNARRNGHKAPTSLCFSVSELAREDANKPFNDGDSFALHTVVEVAPRFLHAHKGSLRTAPHSRLGVRKQEDRPSSNSSCMTNSSFLGGAYFVRPLTRHRSTKPGGSLRLSGLSMQEHNPRLSTRSILTNRLDMPHTSSKDLP
jgi:hypothetical protein